MPAEPSRGQRRDPGRDPDHEVETTDPCALEPFEQQALSVGGPRSWIEAFDAFLAEADAATLHAEDDET